MDARISLLLDALDQAYDARSWHGTNLKGALRGLSPSQAAWRLGKDRPSIQELVRHTAYWKYAVLRQLADLPKGSFPLEGSNWFPCRGVPTEAEWKADRTLLDRTHKALRAAVAALDSKTLDRPSAKKAWRVRDLILGVAAHDLHHGGQIQLIKRMKG